MKVNNYGNIADVMKTYLSRKNDPGESRRATVSGGEDTLELSVQAREMQEIKPALGGVNEIREEKVEKIKKEIASGTYRPDAMKTAEGILQERLLDKHA